MSDDLFNDDVEENQTRKYRHEKSIFAIETSLTAIRTHSSLHKAILWDFALLDLERFQHVINSDHLTEDAFENAEKIKA